MTTLIRIENKGPYLAEVVNSENEIKATLKTGEAHDIHLYGNKTVTVNEKQPPELG